MYNWVSFKNFHCKGFVLTTSCKVSSQALSLIVLLKIITQTIQLFLNDKTTLDSQECAVPNYRRLIAFNKLMRAKNI